jgi:hypothetical protein
VVGPAIPVPESVPPELTVTADELAIEPSTSSVPPLTRTREHHCRRQ